MSGTWPALPLEAWRDTYLTLQRWTQIVGKVCLAVTPLTNHFWNIAFHVTSRGLTTPAMSRGGLTFTATFDFIDHQLVIQTSDGRIERLPLSPQSVADFYTQFMETLQRLGIRVRIWTMPVEIPDPADRIPFERDDVHRSYDAAAVNTFWHVLVAIKPVFERFRGEFIGKCSPVHFFWGSFDLAVTRFSGERAAPKPDADSITREAYSHQVISHGFWPGSGVIQMPAFYAYAAPEPEGFHSAAIRPAAGYYDTTFKEFILPYDAIRTAEAPEAEVYAFLQSTYDAAADLAGWNRKELERR